MQNQTDLTNELEALVRHHEATTAESHSDSDIDSTDTTIDLDAESSLSESGSTTVPLTDTTEPLTHSSTEQILETSSDTETDSDEGYNSDSSYSSDWPDDFSHQYMIDIIMELKITVNSETDEPLYTLRAIPYVHKNDPLNHLSQNRHYLMGNFTGHSETFYKFCHAEGAENILALLNKLQEDSTYILGGVRYSPKVRGAVITGDWAKYNMQSYHRKFGAQQTQAFFSVVDLFCREKTSDNKDALNKALHEQEDQYGMTLTEGEKARLDGILKHLPTNERRREIHQLKKDWQPKPQGENPTGWTTHAHNYLQEMYTWLSGSLTGLWSSPEPMLPPSGPFPSAAELAKERLDIVARVKADNYDSIDSHKADLKRLYELRAYYQYDPSYHNRFALTRNNTHKFWRSIDKHECWNKPEIGKQARKIFIDNLLLSDEILANMESCIRQAGFEPTAARMSQLLANQRYSFCRDFIYSGIIDFYAYYREKAHLELMKGYYINGKQAYGYVPQDATVTNPLFFAPESEENNLRQLYNTFVKQGLYRHYGEDGQKGKDFRELLCCFDHRFVRWSSVDTIKQEPVPETWSEYISRRFSGNTEVPTKERHTFSHPMYDTRPT